MNTNFIFSNFSGAPAISQFKSQQKVWFPWISRDTPNFLAPIPSRGRPPPHSKTSRPKSSGLGSFFVPEMPVRRSCCMHFPLCGRYFGCSWVLEHRSLEWMALSKTHDFEKQNNAQSLCLYLGWLHCKCQGAAKGVRQKEFDHFASFLGLFRSLFLTLLSVFSSLFCRTPFAAGWKWWAPQHYLLAARKWSSPQPYLQQVCPLFGLDARAHLTPDQCVVSLLGRKTEQCAVLTENLLGDAEIPWQWSSMAMFVARSSGRLSGLFCLKAPR